MPGGFQFIQEFGVSEEEEVSSRGAECSAIDTLVPCRWGIVNVRAARTEELNATLFGDIRETDGDDGLLAAVDARTSTINNRGVLCILQYMKIHWNKNNRGIVQYMKIHCNRNKNNSGILQ
jgi:hypothetical protein